MFFFIEAGNDSLGVSHIKKNGCSHMFSDKFRAVKGLVICNSVNVSARDIKLF